MENFIKSRTIVEYLLRMPKDYSSFFYFTLESNEGIAFYSTLESEKGQQYRDVIVRSTPELESELKSIIGHCQKNSSLEILSREEVSE